MTYTSAQANKLLKKLNDEHAALLDKENRSKDFRAAMGEDVESVRPAYDYADTQKKLAELEQRIRKVKHAINVFNATHVIPDFGMTIDEMLVYIPQLTQRKNKLADMKARLPKQRVEEQYGRQSNIIDYSYANYDLTAVEADYEKAADELSRAQLELDAVNQRDTFELESKNRSVALSAPFFITSSDLRPCSMLLRRRVILFVMGLCGPSSMFRVVAITGCGSCEKTFPPEVEVRL